MIRAACVARRQRRHADAPEWLHPRTEDGRHRLVLLQIDAPDRARAVVDVEVGREVRVRWRRRILRWSRCRAGRCRAAATTAPGATRAPAAEDLLHVEA